MANVRRTFRKDTMGSSKPSPEDDAKTPRSPSTAGSHGNSSVRLIIALFSLLHLQRLTPVSYDLTMFPDTDYLPDGDNSSLPHGTMPSRAASAANGNQVSRQAFSGAFSDAISTATKVGCSMLSVLTKS